jgi:hypothetical protein
VPNGRYYAHLVGQIQQFIGRQGVKTDHPQKGFRMTEITRAGRLARLIIGFLLTLTDPRDGTADIIVQETFMDGNITDNQPAHWTLTCFQTECDPNNPSVEYTVRNGEVAADFSAFAMWRLDSVNGVPIEAKNRWSIRSRILPVKRDPDSGMSIVGVGLDEYYWVAPFRDPQAQEAGVSAGRFFDAQDITERLPIFEEWVVQIDVYPDHLEGFRWLVSDPGRILRVNWDRGQEINPGRPVFWGNFSTSAKFLEVVVATEPMGPGGDFDRDGSLDIDDVNELSKAIRARTNDPRYNLTSDYAVDKNDLESWVHGGRRTYFGDSNLDGEFNSGDLTEVFKAGIYEDAVSGNASWQHGDWNADGEFDSGDLVAAFQDGGYEKGPRPATSSVPEPGSVGLLLMGATRLVRRSRRKRGQGDCSQGANALDLGPFRLQCPMNF